jgi:hypothetical protein
VTAIAVSALARPEYLIEIEAVAIADAQYWQVCVGNAPIQKRRSRAASLCG